MNLIELDASDWRTPLDFYDALLIALGAPEWHGRNINALIDSIIVGEINQINSPLPVSVVGLDHTGKTAFDELIHAFAALARQGGTANITSQNAWLEIS